MTGLGNENARNGLHFFVLGGAHSKNLRPSCVADAESHGGELFWGHGDLPEDPKKRRRL